MRSFELVGNAKRKWAASLDRSHAIFDCPCRTSNLGEPGIPHGLEDVRPLAPVFWIVKALPIFKKLRHQRTIELVLALKINVHVYPPIAGGLRERDTPIQRRLDHSRRSVAS